MKKKILISVMAIFIVVVAFLIYRFFNQRQTAQAAASQIQTAKVEKGKLTITIDATGKVRSAQSATLYWGTSGTVEKVNVQLGQSVKAGEVLASLAQTSLPQSVITAQAELESARKALDDLYTNAEAAKTTAMNQIAQYADAVRDAQYQLDNFTVPTNQAGMSAIEALALMEEKLNQARAAFEPYKFSAFDNPTRQQLKKELDQAQADYNAAVKRVQYEYELAVAKANLEQAQKDYESYKNGPLPSEITAAKAKITAAEATLRLAWIEAPFVGTITKALPLPGDQVTANQEAFRIDNLETLYVDLSVSEVDINQVRVGLPVTVTFDAIRGKTYQGEVSQVALVNDETSDTSTYTVTVRLDQVDSQVRPGMTSAVEILIEQNEESLLVPNEAIRTQNGSQVVYVLSPGEGPKMVTVQIGASSDTYTQVLGGELQAGDLVLLNASETSIADGMPPGVFMMRPRQNQSGGSQNPPPPSGGQP
jgi:HlyD family secretion protein